MSSVMDQLRRVTLAGGKAELSDGQILECFLRDRDEAAVAALVRRHGPMVWGVCRRVLGNEQDSEDAFQATFVVFLRKAGSIRPRALVANWLYGVAHRTALKAKAMNAKRHSREKQMNILPEPEAAPETNRWDELLPLLDQELARLPDKYRIAIVLCDLEGRTRKEVARQLNIPEGTLSSRLTTARALLAKRLTRHSPALAGGMLAALLMQQASACVPLRVTAGTIKMIAEGTVPGRVATLSSAVLKIMMLSRLKLMPVLVAMLGIVALGFSAWHPALQSKAAQPATSAPMSDKTRPADYCWFVFGPKTRVLVRWRAKELAIDRNGDGKFDGKGERFSSEKDCKDVSITDPASKTTYIIDQVDDMHVVPPEKFLDVRVHVKGRSYGLWAEVMLAASPQDAPELHFDGPFALAPTGARIVNRASYFLENSLVKLDFLLPRFVKDLAGKKLVDDSSLPALLERGKQNQLFAFVRTQGENGIVTVGSPDNRDGNTPPFQKGIYPIVEVEFPAQKATAAPIKMRFPLQFTRGCFFRAEVVVPAEAGSGKARLTFSFDAWKGGKVRPTTAEVAVEPPK